MKKLRWTCGRCPVWGGAWCRVFAKRAPAEAQQCEYGRKLMWRKYMREYMREYNNKHKNKETK